MTIAAANEESIRAIAYRLWLEEGRPEGRAEQHWFKAVELASREMVIPDLNMAKPKRKVPVRKPRSHQSS